MAKFKFNLNRSYLFSLPQSNHYQKIIDLQLNSPDYQEISFDPNKIIFFENSSSISFFHRAFAINKNIDPSLTLVDYKKIEKQSTAYLRPNHLINGQNQEIQAIARRIVDKQTNLKTIVTNLYQYVLDYLIYDRPIDGLYRFDQALKEKRVDCGGFSTLLASLLQAVNIPSRLVSGFLLKQDFYYKLRSNFDFCPLNFDFLIMHAWIEILLPDNIWFPLDPSIDWKRQKGLTSRLGGLGTIPADRLVVSFGCDHRLKINKKNYTVDLLQKPVHL